MITIYEPDDFPATMRPAAVTIGKFDGVHRGHQTLLELVRRESDRRGLHAVVVTFDRHPLALFAPERCPAPILSPRQQLEQMAAFGVDATVVLPFTRELAKLSPEEFTERVLINQLETKLLIVGRDFRFGSGGAGDAELLQRMGRQRGFEVIIPDDIPGPTGRRASSTWLREALSAGDVELATQMLGRYHVVSGTVVHGAKRGRELGFPTANLDPATVEGLIPADGVYAGWFRVGGKVYPTAVSVGNNPTFEGVPQRQVEAHLLDVDLDLYGESVDIAFVQRIRGMEKFPSLDALIERMSHDVAETRTRLRMRAETLETRHFTAGR
ncbi:bifunctional riboflavin kinase/FAD synthetase [uncultured Gulosibacter sp.]|uniref:bifunctional riboflavin kinase/FAD synthetase n=1 Tax=uncultured Gulosibacter sp. TaxID=1339167 RepID=UPI00288BB9DE|nr:bifunctional riboflavin kinase/FAD synthetase [uncultured Gulosibacter sp.]